MKGVGVRVCAAAGIAGPVVFTAAWIVSSLRQTGHRAASIQISGLAAADARDPWIMITGFLVLGGCCVAFGEALHDAMGGRGQAGPAPWLIQGAGVLTMAAGLLRRDRMLLTAGSVSWHNHAHDVISVVIYVDLVVVQLLLAARFGRDGVVRDSVVRDAGRRDPIGPDRGKPGWRAWRPWLLTSAAATAAALTAFAVDTSAPDAGILQRVAVTIPLAVITAIAVQLVRTGGPPSARVD